MKKTFGLFFEIDRNDCDDLHFYKIVDTGAKFVNEGCDVKIIVETIANATLKFAFDFEKKTGLHKEYLRFGRFFVKKIIE